MKKARLAWPGSSRKHGRCRAELSRQRVGLFFRDCVLMRRVSAQLFAQRSESTQAKAGAFILSFSTADQSEGSSLAWVGSLKGSYDMSIQVRSFAG